MLGSESHDREPPSTVCTDLPAASGFVASHVLWEPPADADVGVWTTRNTAQWPGEFRHGGAGEGAGGPGLGTNCGQGGTVILRVSSFS